MADDHMFVVKAKGAATEQFMLITLSADFSQVVRTSRGMSDKELTSTLSKAGTPESEITAHIEHARKHPQ